MPAAAKEVFGTTAVLRDAADAVRLAANACEVWEDGGAPECVAETAAQAMFVGRNAIEAVVSDEPWDLDMDDPDTRRGRLAYAAWLLTLAGTDERGKATDLRMGAELFNQAAQA